MNKVFKFASIVFAAFLLCSCQKKSIWKEIGEKNSISDPEIAKKICSGKYDLNAFSESGKTVLTAFLSTMSEYEYDILVASGADINLCDENGVYPLFEAVKNDAAVARKVIENVKDINVKNPEGFNVLYEFKSYHDFNYLYWLLKRNIDINECHDGVQPFVDIYADDPSNLFLISYIMSDKFKLNLTQDELKKYSPEIQKGFNYKIKSDETLFSDEYSFKPENVVSLEPAEAPFCFMPSLYTEDEFTNSVLNEYYGKYYLMTSCAGSKDGFIAGTEVKINGYADPKIVNVDGVNCYNYNVTVSGDSFTLPGRYISMYSSEMDVDGDGQNEKLLSNFYFNEGNYEHYIDYTFIDYGDWENFTSEIVLVKNGSPYRITLENKKAVTGIDSFKFTEGDQIPNTVVIEGTSFSSPVDYYKHFYTLCGTELIPICTEDIYSERDFPVYDEFTEYELVKEQYRLHLNFYGKTQMQPDEDEFETRYKQIYTMVSPFVWKKIVRQ